MQSTFRHHAFEHARVEDAEFLLSLERREAGRIVYLRGCTSAIIALRRRRKMCATNKLKRDRRPNAGKINLFQMGPTWLRKQPGIERLRLIGQVDAAGMHSCYSQVTPKANNLGLRLEVQPPPCGIDLHKGADRLGLWARQRLAERLAMKHSRAVFVKAESRTRNGCIQYHYNELIYCERPDIERFVAMVDSRHIVFEFAMTERPPGQVRNHGYPWRLVDGRKLDQLFALQVKLRG